MKRIGHLYEQAFTPENLLAAYHDAARHKRGKRACFEFSRRLGSNLDELHLRLHDGTYRPKPYHTFMVYEPKPRKISAPAFSDLVVQHAIYRVIYPIFNRTFIDQSFACRPGFGTHAAADYAQTALRACPQDSYTLKLDVRKFFYRIDRGILRAQIERKIKDSRFVDVVMLFAEHGDPAGIPIGNLLSQLFALIYLTPLDEFIKRRLGVSRYCRYVDDFVLFGLSRQEALDHKACIEAFLHSELNLQLSKWTLAPVGRGVNFVGYRTWRTKRFIRKHSLHRFTRAARAGRLDSVVSILGHARRTWSLRYLTNQLKEHHHALHHQLPQIYRRDRRQGTAPTHQSSIQRSFGAGVGDDQWGDIRQPA